MGAPEDASGAQFIVHTVRGATRLSTLKTHLFEPVDGASLAFFRICLGAIVAWEAWRRLTQNYLEQVNRPFLANYWPFRWVRPMPEELMEAWLLFTAAAGICMAIGLFYRASSTLAWLGITYGFLLSKTTHLNHIYLMGLLLFVSMFLPAARVWSVDAFLGRVKPGPWVPRWSVWLLRFQLGVPYFFAGVQKLNYDWLVLAEPLRTYLIGEEHVPILGPYLELEPVVWAMNYLAVAFDLSIVFLLIFRRTRLLGAVLAAGFHLMNASVFAGGIGVFPWMMLAVTPAFFEPDWPRRVLEDSKFRRSPHAWLTSGGALLGVLIAPAFSTSLEIMQLVTGGIGFATIGYLIAQHFFEKAGTPARAPAPEPLAPAAPSRPIMALLAVWAALQILLPLRHFVIPGNTLWTMEGHRFAWRMLLVARDGQLFFDVVDPLTEEKEQLDNRQYLSPRQIATMRGRPDMVWQFAQFLADDIESRTGTRPQIYARAMLSINGRPSQPIIDPTVNLAEAHFPRFLGHAEWITELKED